MKDALCNWLQKKFIHPRVHTHTHSHTHTLQAITDSFNSNASRLHVHFTNAEVYIAVAIYAIGGMTGALTGGFIADHIGRYKQTRRTMPYNANLFYYMHCAMSSYQKVQVPDIYSYESSGLSSPKLIG